MSDLFKTLEKAFITCFFGIIISNFFVFFLMGQFSYQLWLVVFFSFSMWIFTRLLKIILKKTGNAVTRTSDLVNKTVKNNNSKKSLLEDELYSIISLEIDHNDKKKSTWIKAIAQSDGDTDKEVSNYIKLRFLELKNEKE